MPDGATTPPPQAPGKLEVQVLIRRAQVHLKARGPYTSPPTYVLCLNGGGLFPSPAQGRGGQAPRSWLFGNRYLNAGAFNAEVAPPDIAGAFTVHGSSFRGFPAQGLGPPVAPGAPGD